MSDPANPEALEINLGDKCDRLHFTTPDKLQQWSQEEFNCWQSLRDYGNPLIAPILQQQQQFHNELSNLAGEWRQRVNSKSQWGDTFQKLTSVFQRFIGQGQLITRTHPFAAVIQQIREKNGEAAAAGAYVSFLSGAHRANELPSAKFFEGLFDAILFKREIDWTATTHQEALNRLKVKYDDNIAIQDRRAKEIEQRNQLLNTEFDNTIKEHQEKLNQLHSAQAEEFKTLVAKHDENQKSIEETYDKKLALQKPVEYWEKKEQEHSASAKRLAISTVIVAIGAGAGMAWLIHWVLINLPAGQDPKPWQLGMLITSAFLAIWWLRILVRLFLSNHHLATDAAERKTMILTYIAFVREGADVKPEDKNLILQHIFRAASDGLVKDDGAPPSPLEFFTRTPR